jgi:hypothetical protein
MRIERLWRRYDHKIVEFVVRYTSDVGFFRPIPDLVLAKRIVVFADRRLADPAPVSPEEALRMMERLKWAKIILDREFAEAMAKLVANKKFDDALEFSITAKGISQDDRWPRELRDIPINERRGMLYQHFKELKERDPEKYSYLFRTNILDMIHPRAYEATAAPHGMLEVHAMRLRLNLHDVTPTALARELKISVPTLYRRYGQTAMRRVCQLRAVRDEAPSETRFQVDPLCAATTRQR